MIDPARVALFVPAGLRKFKLNLFNRIGSHIEAKGGLVVREDAGQLDMLPADVIPVVGCQPESTALIAKWRREKREFIYWDRGYWLRVFATWLPRGENGGMYRWHRNAYQLQSLRDVPRDRFEKRPPPVGAWKRGGRHIVIAAPTPTYSRFHALDGWIEQTLDALAKHTDRQVVIRCKETKRSLQADLEGAHCLVAHGSIAAVEAVICGCPVFVHPDSAASLVGLTDLSKIESPVYPDRTKWLHSLAYSHFDERELIDGTVWRLIA